jgi:hypothetical protein
VARELCPEDRFRAFARAVLLELCYPAKPVCPRGEPQAEATERSSRELLRKELERFLVAEAVSPGDLLKPPERADYSCQAYCPRCEAQFTASTGVCEDCGGLALLPFPVPPAANAR